jgi:CheY-like chemotaxis protein
MFSALARNKKLDLAFHISSEIPAHVVGDPNRFFQVLLNLIGNAIKFTDAGGVAISADVVRSSGSELELRVCVADTGIGIHPDHQKIIFEPFRQADDSLSRKFDGTGLGLSLVSGLVALMGGRIWLESEPGKGSKFFFTVLFGLPLVAVQNSESQTQPGSTPSVSKADNLRLPVNILVVEDNPINQKFAVGMLQKQGYQVGVAENGQEALAKLKESSFDLILMDIQMPIMNGLEATLEIRRLEQDSARHIPIVALTAHASPEDRERCLHAGMDEYLSKPISGKKLTAVIAQVYERIHGANLPPTMQPHQHRLGTT